MYLQKDFLKQKNSHLPSANEQFLTYWTRFKKIPRVFLSKGFKIFNQNNLVFLLSALRMY